ncbi:MAG: sigma-70 family RNA polymerase sigma factor [Clostridia bacterium]|nr:sigma-70 family RNA polymerase sigma factor [Clostridia bacterium]
MRKRLTNEQYAFLDDLAIRYSDVLMSYAMRFLNYRQHLQPLAQECVQDVFLRAVANVEALMKHENPVGWLKVTLRHILLHAISSASFRREEHMADTQAYPKVQQQSAAEALELWETSQQLSEVLTVAKNLLTVDEQRTLDAHFCQGLTTAETALLESVPESTIRGRISRIRRKLRKHFPELCLLLLLTGYMK